MAPGAASLNLRDFVDDPAFGTYTVPAGGGSQLTEVTDPAAVSCVNSADLEVTKDSGPDTDTFGNVVSTITVTNGGPDTATNVNASDNVDTGLTVTNVTCSDGGVPTIFDPAECDWASIPNAGIRTMIVTSSVNDDQAGANLCNQVAVTMSNGVVDPDGASANERQGSITVDAALIWLEGHRGSRFFLWVHLFEPHAPYGDQSNAAPSPIEIPERSAANGRAGCTLSNSSDPKP
jgi:uncharacterized repeat protein (TIGR01451 family)